MYHCTKCGSSLCANDCDHEKGLMGESRLEAISQHAIDNGLCARPGCELPVTAKDFPFCSTECDVEWSSHQRPL